MELKPQQFENITNTNGIILATWAQYLSTYNTPRINALINTLIGTPIPKNNRNTILDYLAHAPHPIGKGKDRERFYYHNTPLNQSRKDRALSVTLWSLAHQTPITEHACYQRTYFGDKLPLFEEETKQWWQWRQNYTYINHLEYTHYQPWEDKGDTRDLFITRDDYQRLDASDYLSIIIVETVFRIIASPNPTYTPILTPALNQEITSAGFFNNLTQEALSVYQDLHMNMRLRCQGNASDLELFLILHAPEHIVTKIIQHEPLAKDDCLSLIDLMENLLPVDDEHVHNIIEGNMCHPYRIETRWGQYQVENKTTTISTQNRYLDPRKPDTLLRAWLYMKGEASPDTMTLTSTYTF
jgi:hypothetical protein